MINGYLNYQDWKPVAFSRTPEYKKNGLKNDNFVAQRRTSTTMLPKKLCSDFDPENMQKVVVSTRDLANAIRIARAKLPSSSNPTESMTQMELDKMCCFPANTIKNYENCTAKIVPEQLNKLNRVLHVVLPRPK